MRILVTGAGGQLGKELGQVLAHWNHAVLLCGRDTLDVTDLENCQQVVEDFRPDAILHTAAYTAVDNAESDVDGAWLVNAYGTRNVATAAERVQARVCYVSTDYVFGGDKQAAQRFTPLEEFETPYPINVYGRSKWAGEQLLKAVSRRFYIVRTSWVYGQHGNNFVKTMLKLGRDRGEVSVVDDQTGSPTYTADLARFLVDLAQTERYGIYHASNSGQCTWYEFAKAIFEEANLDVRVNPISTSQFPRPARRPVYSVLGNQALRLNGFTPLRHWRDALAEFLQTNAGRL